MPQISIEILKITFATVLFVSCSNNPSKSSIIPQTTSGLLRPICVKEGLYSFKHIPHDTALSSPSGTVALICRESVLNLVWNSNLSFPTAEKKSKKVQIRGLNRVTWLDDGQIMLFSKILPLKDLYNLKLR